MPRRYRRYSRRRRTYYRKKKWTAYSSELTVNSAGGALAASSFVELGYTGIYGSSNSLNNDGTAVAPVSAINYYACRCRFKGVLGGTFTPGMSYIVYIAYVPNAVTINNAVQQNTSLANSFFYKHPEYVLAWNRLDYITDTGDTGEVSLYSRITKRVAPGDQIGVFLLAKNSTANAINTVAVQGTFSCYLRTN